MLKGMVMVMVLRKFLGEIGPKKDSTTTFEGRINSMREVGSLQRGFTINISATRKIEKVESNSKDGSVRLSKWKQGIKIGSAF